MHKRQRRIDKALTEADVIPWQNFSWHCINDAVFFRWVQTSVRFSGSGSQKVLLIIFFRKLLEKNAKNRRWKFDV